MGVRYRVVCGVGARLIVAAAVAVLSGCSAHSDGDASVRSKRAALSPTSTTQAADEIRTGWYSNQPELSPSVVSGPSFGQLFSVGVNGQVYAQPLVSQGTLFVVTETNNIYGLDPETGATRWTRNVGNAFGASSIGCGDLAPFVGISGTPVIDSATNVAYFFAKRYASGTSGPAVIEAHAVKVATGVEQAGFPVLISGNDANDPTHPFTPDTLMQRPGLLLLNGVVYAGFGSHCDLTPWTGWVVGVSTAGTLTTLWSPSSGPNRRDGAGIWHAGNGLLSDGDGQILVATGNGASLVGPIDGHSPPQTLGESIVRMRVQPNGTLQATDFFAPYDSVTLDSWDADLGAGGPAGLPSPYFGTVQYPHLMVAAGKQGYVYLLDRDNLGGIGNGPGGGDSVVGRIGPYGGVWSKPAVWPGEGGWVYLPTASGGVGGAGNLRVFRYGLDGLGKPALSLVATSTDAFGFSSGTPIVTSDETLSGSALVWVVWTPDGSGDGAQLRAYDPIPVGGVPVLRYSAPIGQAAKFVSPGVGDGRLYVGTRDARVRAFGAPMHAPLRSSGLRIASTTVGSSSQDNLTVTANAALTVTSVASSNPDFVLGYASPALPAALAANATLTIPVTFAPSATGLRAGSVVFQTSAGPQEVAVSGQGLSVNAQLSAAPQQLSFGGVVSGAHAASSVTFTNAGGAPLVIHRVASPTAPFSLSGAPAPEAVLAPNASLTITVNFDPVSLGSYMSSVALDTDAGLIEVPLSGVCAPPGHLSISQLSIDFGARNVGDAPTASFTVSNTGGSSLRITRSKPPALGTFHALTSLPEGTTLVPGQTLTEYISYVPTSAGTATDTWSLNGDDGGAVQEVSLTGVAGVLEDFTTSGTIVALITNPIGGGSRNIELIRDGVTPTVGSSDSALQYDTYDGGSARAEDWIGYTFTANKSFSKLVFQEGMNFYDGGAFATLQIQVRQGTTWVNVPNVTVTPAYAGANGINFETFTFNFPDIVGNGIRIDGNPAGSAHFVSVAELRVFGTSVTSANTAPNASAGTAQSVASGALVSLDGSASSDPEGDSLSYSWTQTAGPAVTLSSATAQKPTFTAPTVSASTALTFSLVVSDGSLSSSAATVTITIAPPIVGGPDITASGTIVAFITAPTGGGSRNLQIIRDGVTPAVGSSDWSLQYDTYKGGGARAEDWIGYTFTTDQSFGKVVFQEGGNFADGGAFTSLRIQVRQGTTWVNVPSVTVSPAYPGANGVSFETFTFVFPPIVGNGIRIDGTPSGSAHFMSVAELHVFGS